ncbi:MAG: pyridoxal-phosphate dependent enzyme [Polyangiaceae bacterium]
MAGVGTGGTITGVGRALRRLRPGTRIVLADPVGSALAELVNDRRPGPDAPYAVEGIGSSTPPGTLDLSVIDEAIAVDDAESFAVARRLWLEEGLLVGGSAGTAVAAALLLAASGRVAGPIVVLLPDSWDRYLSREWLRGPG